MALNISKFVQDAYTGVVQSGVTSNVYFIGDAFQFAWSLVTSSATASTWTIQASNDGGFQSAIGAATWVNAQGATAPGLYAISTASMPRWVRFLRTPSNSSSTVAFNYRIGI